MSTSDTTTPAASQRQALVEALSAAGEEAPTLCEGWQTWDLATHILVRERRPEAMIASHLPVVNRYASAVERQYQKGGYETILRRIAEGPGRFSPASLPAMDHFMNTLEYFVHTEDVLRAAEDFDPENTRSIREDVAASLWKQGSRAVFALTARQAKKHLIFESPGYGVADVGAKKAAGERITGTPGELILWVMGRQEAAQVEISSL